MDDSRLIPREEARHYDMQATPAVPRNNLMRTAFVFTLVASALSIPCADLCAQVEPTSRIHWYLEQKLDRSGPADRLPVYFVMADQLGYDHWFPRVNRLHVDVRRMLVVAELKAHATYTQKGLVDRLRERESEGTVTGVRSNWLGNFVSCDATPGAVRDLARHESVLEVRYRAAWPRGEVEDTSPFDPPQLGGVPAMAPSIRARIACGGWDTPARESW